MPLAEVHLNSIAAAVAAAVPEDLLAQIVKGQMVVSGFDAMRKTVDDPAGGRLFALARWTLEEYDKKNKSHELLLALFRKVDWSPTFLETISPFAVAPNLSEDQRQALHRRRDHFISSPNLLRFTREIEPRICCIIGGFNQEPNVELIGGTGFLVAPDLVLTAAHVFEPAIATIGKNQVPGHCALYFDYVDAPEITTRSVRRNGVRRVELADKWLVEMSGSLANDGQVVPETEERRSELKKHLDFALIRLAEPVGLESVSEAGGMRRQWIELPTENPLLSVDSYVNIAQHPFGQPREIGFGRFTKPCPSKSRFWYDTESDKGASGAPCLSRDFDLIGLHNAAYAPEKFNQAIDIGLIAARIKVAVADSKAGASVPPPPLLWNLAPCGTTERVVLGRGVFLNWLARASSETPSVQSDRLYAADAPRKGSGKSFSVEILRRMLEHRREQKPIVFGADGELIPRSVEDMIRVLADQLAVPAARLDEMPARPGTDLPSAANDGDKLRLWASETIPNWFAELVEDARPKRIDRRQKANIEVQALNAAGKPVPDSLNEEANAPEPIWIDDGWRVAWIALDGLIETKLPAEIRDLISGLSGANREEAVVPPALKRLRWLFLGYRPDFVGAGRITFDTLDPKTIGPDDAVATLRHAWASRGLIASDASLATFREYFEEVAHEVETNLPDEYRMTTLQLMMGPYINTHLPKPRVR